MRGARGGRPARQRGVVLVISMLMLLILAVLSAASMNATVMEEKMAANNQYKTVSFQVAESAIERLAARPTDSLQRALRQSDSNFIFTEDLGNAFDPVVGGAVVTAARAEVGYCGERSATGVSMNAEVSSGVPKYKLHVLDISGEGRVAAAGARVNNERRVGTLLAGRALRSCPPAY